jgi:hypothetical protein
MIIFFLTIFVDLIKTEKLDLSFINDMQHFYKTEYVNDENVRKSWFYFCYYFLPICNKDWKDHIQLDRLSKTEIIYNQISTSDEAIVHFFLLLWAPKIQIEKDNKWPVPPKTHGEGDQELKARINEYSAIHHSILKYKSHNQGEFASIWNDIFWEEAKKHFPNSFSKKNINQFMTSESSGNENLSIPLPGIDDDNTFSMFVAKRKITSSAKINVNDEAIEHNKIDSEKPLDAIFKDSSIDSDSSPTASLKVNNEKTIEKEVTNIVSV